MKKNIILSVFVVALSFVGGVSVVNAQATTQIYNVAYDNEINSRTPNTVRSSSSYINIGHRSTYGDEIMQYIGKFNINKINSKSIQRAVIKIDRVSNSWDAGTKPYGLYQITAPWNTQTATYNNIIPIVDMKPYVNGTLGKYGVSEFDVTGIVKGWMNGSIANNGFMVKKVGDTNIAGNEYGQFASTNYPINGAETRPYLEITYNETTPPLSITVTSPNGGEVWEVGKTYQIKWDASSHPSSTIDIGLRDNRYNLNLGSGENVIARNIPNTGSYRFTVPSSMGTLSEGALRGDNVYTVVVYVDRGRATSKFDESDAPFSIVEAGINEVGIFKAQTESLIATIVNLQNQLLLCKEPISLSDSNDAISAANQVLLSPTVTVAELTEQINILLEQITFLQTQIVSCEDTSTATSITSIGVKDVYTLGNDMYISWTPTLPGVSTISLVPLDGHVSSYGIYGMKVFGDPVNTAGNYTYKLPKFTSSMKPGKYYLKLIFADGSPDAVSGTFTIQDKTTAIPTITSISPNPAEVGQEVKILGNNFNNRYLLVQFKGIDSYYDTDYKDGELYWTVPAFGFNPGTYSLRVIDRVRQVAGESEESIVSNWVPLTVVDSIQNKPTISYFSPSSGSVGAKITIKGFNFTKSNKITFVGAPNRGAPVYGEKDFRNLYSSDGKTLTFSIPSIFSKTTSESGAIIQNNVTPGRYYVVVQTKNGKSKPAYFTVTAPTPISVHSPRIPVVTPPTLTPTPSTMFTRNMWKGLRGNDVKKLQRLFNSREEFRLADKGPGSPGNETSYYGFLLRSAVQNFQCKYGIACSGSQDGNGYGVVGPKTRVKIQEIFSARATVAIPVKPPVVQTPTPPSYSPPATSTLQQQIQQMIKQLQLMQKQLKALQSAMVVGAARR